MLTLIWVFHLLAHLQSCFCQIPIRPGRIGQTVEHSKFKSAQPSPRGHGTPRRAQYSRDSLPLSDEESDGRDEGDDADERAEVAGGGGLVEDAHFLPLVVVVVPSIRRDRTEHKDGENLQFIESDALLVASFEGFCAYMHLRARFLFVSTLSGDW